MKKLLLFIAITAILHSCRENNSPNENKDMKHEKDKQVSLNNFPEELIGFWSCNCETDKFAESGAETPPGFIIQKRSEGYDAWYQRCSGIITEIKGSENIFKLKFEDESCGGEIEIEIELNNALLTVNGGGICEGWGGSGMEKCKL